MKVYKDYRFPTMTTMEHLACDLKSCYDTMVQYGEHIILAVTNFRGEVIAAIYEFIETEEETGYSTIECRLNLAEISTKTFEDTGHAIAWALNNLLNQ